MADETALGLTLIERQRGLDQPAPLLVAAQELYALQARQAAETARLWSDSWNACRRPGDMVSPFSASGTAIIDAGANSFGNWALCPTWNYVEVGSGGGDTVKEITWFATYQSSIYETVLRHVDDRSAGAPVGFVLTGSGAGLDIVSEAGTYEAARAALLAQARGASGRRIAAGRAVSTGGGAQTINDTPVSERLTGRDAYLGFSPWYVGPLVMPELVGLRICETLAQGCYGGIAAPVPLEYSAIVARYAEVLYITRLVDRVITGGTSLYDVPLIALPFGAVHPAAQAAGLDQTDRFLRRLTGEKARGLAPERASFWLEGFGDDAALDGVGVISGFGASSAGMRGGAMWRYDQNWVFGASGEYASGRVGVNDAITPESASTNNWKVGLHTSYRNGPFSLTGAATAGRVDIATTGFSAGGASSASYGATVYGASLEAGYDIPAHGFTVTPHAGLSWLGWYAGEFTETGGLGPLAVASRSANQGRAYAGVNLGWQGDGVAAGIYGRVVAPFGDSAQVVALDPLTMTTLTVAGPGYGRAIGEFGASVGVAFNDSVSLNASYDGRVSNTFASHGGRFLLKVKF